MLPFKSFKSLEIRQENLMVEFLSVAFFWILIMVLIGIALWLVPKISVRIDEQKKEKEKTQDIADE